jgi:hypothetical protein
MNKGKQVMISEDAAVLREGATLIRGNYTSHAGLNRILRLVGFAVTRRNVQSEGPVHTLIGMTRSGKSHLLKVLLARYDNGSTKAIASNGDTAVQKPVVYLKFTGRNVKRVAEQVYFAITGKSPQAVLGSKCAGDDIKREIYRHRKECGIRLLILDEAHQSIMGANPATEEIAVFVKDLSNEHFSVLVVGTGDTIHLINADPELQARAHKIHRIHPFTRTTSDMAIWIDILNNLDKVLADNVFGKPCGLSAPDMAEALMTASGGVVGHMATLIENAAFEAIDQWNESRLDGTYVKGSGGPAIIGWEHLEIVFAEWGPGQDRDNPFDRKARPPTEGTQISDGDIGKKTVIAVGPPKMSGVKGKTAKGAKANVFKA